MAMKLLISLSLISILLFTMTFTVTQSAEDNKSLFFKKSLDLFTDVVHELKMRISELKEEVQILESNASEIRKTVNNVQSQVSRNTQGLEDLKTSGTFVHAIVEKLERNVSENALNIQNMEIVNSETEHKILNLTIAVSHNAISILNLRHNTSTSSAEVKTSKSKSCLEVKVNKSDSKSGVYEIFPTRGQINGVEVYCDLDTEGGGWTVFQSRSDKGPRLDFYRGWADYEKGFGTPGNEHWMGLQNLAAMTSAGDQELRIQLVDWDNEFVEAKYSEFKVADGSDKYRLSIGNFTGTAGDSLNGHNGMAFTTRDQDNDKDGSRNCAHDRRGAWWYNNCAWSNLNGDPNRNGTRQGIYWYHWGGYSYSMKTVQMKIRTRDVL